MSVYFPSVTPSTHSLGKRSCSLHSLKEDMTSSQRQQNCVLEGENGIDIASSALRKCKSESHLVCKNLEETLSLHSEPLRCHHTSKSIGAAVESPTSKSDTKNVDGTDSECSIVDLFQVSERPDPVVVFWEKSDKREQIETSVIVKFSLPSGNLFTHTFFKMSSVSDIKHTIADMFKVPISVIQLAHNNVILQDNMSISDIAIERFGSVNFQLTSLDINRYPLILNNVYPDIPTNDVLTVMVHKGANVMEVIVEIENRAISKPFLGGYRHKISGLEYHHACSQTAPKASKENVTSRDTQTHGQSKTTETNKEKFTQTSLLDKKLIHTGEVIEGDPQRSIKKLEEENLLLEQKTLLIQRNLRSWLVRKMMLKMKEEYKRCLEWEKGEQLRKLNEKEERRKEKEAAENNPQSKRDLELLFHNLEEWRQKETDRVNNIDSTALRKTELCAVLDMEVQLINRIERQRAKSKKDREKKMRELFLEKTAMPVQWRGSQGKALWMDSLGTQRARELRALYQSLQETSCSAAQRIQILESLKSMLSKQENKLVPELISLLDQEWHIIVRDVKQAKMNTLRERINYLFLEYIKDPNVNPEAAKYLPEETCRKVKLYKCLSCLNVKPFYDFLLHSKANDFRKCINCCWWKGIGGPRIDINPIRHIMNAVRREELKQLSHTSVALVMQEQDFYHLIVNIWLGHSAIGGSGNLEELRMGRWDFTQDWSPWNCILLTSEELKAHLRFSNPEQIYSLSFVKRIKQRHQIGQIHFSELATYSTKKNNVTISVKEMLHNFKAAKVHLDKLM